MAFHQKKLNYQSALPLTHRILSRGITAVLLFCSVLLLAQPLAHGAKVNLADGFDFPVGKPNAAGYYKARGLRLRSPTHFGEDWNGRGGGDTDLRDPVYSCADGIVTFAHNVRQGWGNVVLVRHAYRDPGSGKVRYVDSLYGHLDRMMVKVGQKLKRGEQLGTIGSNFGMYPAHLHFEIRHNISIGMHRNAAPSDLRQLGGSHPVHQQIPSPQPRMARRLHPHRHL